MAVQARRAEWPTPAPIFLCFYGWKEWVTFRVGHLLQMCNAALEQRYNNLHLFPTKLNISMEKN